jgi:hypothetical protein
MSIAASLMRRGIGLRSVYPAVSSVLPPGIYLGAKADILSIRL